MWSSTAPSARSSPTSASADRRRAAAALAAFAEELAGGADAGRLAAESDGQLVAALAAGVGVVDADPQRAELLAEAGQRRPARAVLPRRQRLGLAGHRQRDEPRVIGGGVVLLQLDLHVGRIGQRGAAQRGREEA